MRRSLVGLVMLCLLLLLVTAPLSAQVREPVWVTVERARRMELEREFGRAIQLYLRVLELDRGNAEATLGLGRVFRDVADPEVARDYFDQALALRDSFVVPEDAVVLRYERAVFFRDLLDYANYERELDAILAEDLTETGLPQHLLRVFYDNGLDETLVLYRSVENSATRARGMLAEFLVGMGRYGEAGENAIRAVVEEVTTISDALIVRDPFFQFTTVDDALERARLYPETRAYLSSTALFHDLYYLAAALLGEQHAGTSEVWRIVANAPEAGTYGNLASRQLAAPRLEPLIVDTE